MNKRSMVRLLILSFISTMGYLCAASQPAIYSLSPIDDAQFIPPTTNLVITFDQPVAKGTSGTIIIKKAVDDSIYDSIPVSSTNVVVSGSNVFIYPFNNFATNGTTYYVLIDSNSFYDGALSWFPGITNRRDWNFTSVELMSRPVFYVKASAAGANNGSSWTDAYTNLAYALSQITNPADIWVAAGTYLPGSNKSSSFSLKTDIALYGGFNGSESAFSERDPTTNRTILSGDVLGNDIGFSNRSDNVYHVVVGNYGAILDGFLIKGGHAYLGEFFHRDNYGGGILCDIDVPIIRNCLFSNNYAHVYGGALYIGYADNEYASGPKGLGGLVQNCSFVSNRCYYYYGGGVFLGSYTGLLINSVFINNFTINSNGFGGAIGIGGNSIAWILSCSIYGNGHNGIAVVESSDVYIGNTILWENTGSRQVEVDTAHGCSAYLFNNIIQGGLIGSGLTDGGGNLTNNPLFVAQDRYDLKIMSDSPAIDAAHGDYVTSEDYLGWGSKERWDDPTVTNTGTGSITYADIGAHEFHGPTAPLPIDDGSRQYVTNILHCTWTNSYWDTNDGPCLVDYFYCVGTAQWDNAQSSNASVNVAARSIKNWTWTNDMDVTLTNLSLVHGGTYYFNVQARRIYLGEPKDVSKVASSDGITVDLYPGNPTVNVFVASTQMNPTNGLPVKFTVVFSEPVRNFTNSALNITGTAGATNATISGTWSNYTVSVGGASGSGTIILSIPSNVVFDLTGDPNLASTNTNNIVWYDTIAPTLTGLSPSNGETQVPSSTNLTMTFSEDVKAGFGTITIRKVLDNSIFETFVVTGANVTCSGNQVVISPTNSFTTNGVQYYVQVPSGAIKDIAGNNFAGFTNTASWQFITIDGIGPTVTVEKAVGQGNPTNTLPIRFSIVFNEPVIGFSTSSITLYGTASPSNMYLTGTWSNYTLTISNVAQTGTIVAAVTSSVCTDLSGNPNANSYSTDNVIHYENVPPALYSLSPPNGSTNVGATQPLILAFDESMQKGIGTVYIRHSFDNSIFEAIPASSSNITISGTNITIIHSIPFATNGTPYYVQIPSNTFKDLANNAFAGFTNKTTWAFLSEDNVPLTVTINQATNQMDPTNGSPIRFTAIFSEPVFGFTNSGVALSGTANPTIAQVTGSGSNYTILVSGMTSTGTVIATIPAGVAFDAQGNSNEASTSIDNVVTFDNVAPQIASLSPSNGETHVSANTNLTMVLTKPVIKGSGSIVIRRMLDHSIFNSLSLTNTNVVVSSETITIYPTNAFATNGIQYYVQVPNTAFRDAAGNYFAGFTNPSVWNFVTEDGIGPTVSVYRAANQNTPTNTLPIRFTVAFNEPVVGFTNEHIVLSGTAGATNPVVSAVWSNFYYTVTISNLLSNGTVYCSVPADVVTDLTGNSNAASAGTNNFVVFDNIPPQVASLSPPNGSSNIAGNTVLELTFTEAVRTNVGTITIRKGDDHSIFESYALSSSNLTITTNKLIITPSTLFDTNGILYYVQVPSNSFKDLANNSFHGFTNSTTWSFRTIDGIPPSVTISLATNQNTPTNTLPIRFRAIFSEPVLGFTNNSVIISGTAGGTNVSVSGSWSNYIISVNSVASTGTVIATIPAGTVVDYGGNSNTASTGTNNIVLYDNIAPLATLFSPSNNSTNISADAPLVITFSEPMQKGSGFISIRDAATTQLFENISVTGPLVSIADNIVTIQHANIFITNGVTYFVQVPSNAFRDLANNYYTGFTNSTSWRFRTFDGLNPTCIINRASFQASPTNKGPVYFTCYFSEPVFGFTNTSVVISGSAGYTGVVVSGSWSNYTVGVYGLKSNGTVIATVPAGVAFDVCGNPNLASLSLDNTVEYETNKPYVVATYPTNNATYVPLTDDLVMWFNEPMQKGSSGNIKIMCTDGTTLQQISINAANITVADNEVRINHTTPLSPQGKKYYVTIDPTCLRDRAGNLFPGISAINVWTFTSVDIQGPSVTVSRASSQAAITNAGPIRFTVAFSEPIMSFPASVVSIEGTAGATTATITTNGTGSTNYTVHVTGMTTSGTVKISIPAGVVFDFKTNGNFASIGVNDTVTYDIEPPELISLRPPNGMTNVNYNTNFYMAFNENMQKGFGEFVIYRKDNSEFERIDVSSTKVQITGSNVMVNPTASLESEVEYYIIVSNGFVRDMAGNIFTGITNTNQWRFIAQDTLSPVPVDFIPPNGGTNVGITNELKIIFDEGVYKGSSGNIVIRRENESVAYETIPVTTDLVDVAGSTVTIYRTIPLETNGTLYNVQIASTCFRDMWGHYWSGIGNPTGWTFRSIDLVAPTVSVTLASGQTLVTNRLPIRFQVAFSEYVTGFTNSGVVLSGTASGLTNIQITGSWSNYTVAVSGANASAGTVILSVPAGVAFDRAGLSNTASATTNNLVIYDTNPPVALIYSPTNNAVNVPWSTNLFITFDEPIRKGNSAAKITIREASGAIFDDLQMSSTNIVVTNDTLIIYPRKWFSITGIVYYVQIQPNCISDLGGNMYPGFSNATDWTFRSKDIIPPAVTNFSPTNNATKVPYYSSLAIIFNEVVEKGSNNITIRKLSDHSIFETIAVTGANVVASSNILNIYPVNFFSTNAETYYVQVDSGAVHDVWGNDFTGFTNSLIWRFTSVDLTPPVDIALNPTSGAIAVPITSVLEITFSEPIYKGTEGNVVLKTFHDNGVHDTLAITSTNITIATNIARIRPKLLSTNGYTYYVMISNTCFRDASTNYFAPLWDSNSWHFRSVDLAPPVIENLSPPPGAENVASTSLLVITFNEQVFKGSSNIIIWDAEQDILFESIDVTSTQVSISNNVVTIDPTNNFYTNAYSYFVLINSNCFVDKAGNKFAGITNSDVWYFTSEDLIPRITWYVNINATGAGTGTNWTDAFQDLNQALAVADYDHEIWVAAGTYKPDSSSRTNSFRMKKRVDIYGGFIGTETNRNQRDFTNNITILSGDFYGDDDGFNNNSENAYHVVRGADRATLDGFWIVGGNANATITNFHPDSYGGGMLNDKVSPIIRNCIFSNNAATLAGGAMYNGDTSKAWTQDPLGSNTYARIENSIFVANTSGWYGAAIYCGYYTGRIANVIICNNRSAYAGGGITVGEFSSPTIYNTVFYGNRAVSFGGAINSFINSFPTLQNCILWNNGITLPIYNEYTSASKFRTSCVEGSLTNTGARASTNLGGNIYSNPFFVDPSNGDFRIKSCSPCIDIADATKAPTEGFVGWALHDSNKLRIWDTSLWRYWCPRIPRSYHS